VNAPTDTYDTFRRFLTHPFGKGAAILLVWLMIGALFSVQSHYYQMSFGQPVNWMGDLLRNSVYTALWAFCTPFILMSARRYRIERNRWALRLLTHLLIALLVAVIQRVLYSVALWLVTSPPQPLTPSLVLNSLLGYFDYGVYIYFIILFLDHALEYSNSFHREQLRAARLSADLTAVQLQALRAQMNPHFLFNTLNSIAVLIRDDPDSAIDMLDHLSALLRLTLTRMDTQEVPLEEELKFLDRYCLIEQARFGDRLTVRKNIDPAVLHALVPYLVLQPLVENAVRHGIGRTPGPGTIEIGAVRENGILRLTVSDTGPGISNDTSASTQEGIGIANTQKRLAHLYGDAQHFELKNRNQEGLLVTVAIPYHVDRSTPPDLHGDEAR